MMKFEDALKQRHTVRRYLDKPLPESFIDVMKERVEMNNQKLKLQMKLKANDSHAFSPFFKLILAKGVKNYFILAGPDSKSLAESIGYAGADLMLFAQSLGLNTWWVASTYSKRRIRGMVPGTKVLGIITLGYGVTQGVPHKSKTSFEVSEYIGETPEWFKNGVDAALYAPTAINHQRFFIRGKGNKVMITVENGQYSQTDKGILKYHFEIGAGISNFVWVDSI